MSIPIRKNTGASTFRRPEPDVDFVDNTVKVYKMIDGVKTLVRTEDPFPEGWDVPRWVKKKNEEEAEMAKISPEDRAKIITEYKIIKAANPERSMKSIAKELEVPTSTLYTWLNQKPKKDLPSAEQLKKDYVEFDCKINTVARKYGISWAKCKDLLRKAGLIDGLNQPVKEQLKVKVEESIEDPEEVNEEEGTKPDVYPLCGKGMIKDDRFWYQGRMICHNCGLTPSENVSIQYEPADNDWSVEDEEPIPYTVLPREVVTDHHVIATEIATLLDAKRADYGADNIRKFGSLGVLIRVSDKVERLINLQDKKTNFETKEDTWLDIAGYAMLALIELRAGR